MDKLIYFVKCLESVWVNVQISELFEGWWPTGAALKLLVHLGIDKQND